jgi:hypothetical protein
MNIWTRFWFALLVVTDRLLSTHLVERKLARLQRHIEMYETQASTLLGQMGELNRLLYVVQVQFCVIYLRQRQLLRQEAWLRFAPAGNGGEERELDLLIDRLVKHGLAAVRTEPAGEQAYVYHLRPDWVAIFDLLSARKEGLDSATAAWLEEMRRNENGKIHY